MSLNMMPIGVAIHAMPACVWTTNMYPTGPASRDTVANYLDDCVLLTLHVGRLSPLL